ncbi:hypothetical protein ACA910_018829 [Epithemia clementina (nom. ined.)]
MAHGVYVALGVEPLLTRAPIQKIDNQSNLGDKITIAMIANKLEDVWRKQYVVQDTCVATMNYFCIPKWIHNIHMVYNGTKSGLNNCLYTPWLNLPNADVMIPTLDTGKWCIDDNYGKMFFNFWIHQELMGYSRMDLTPLYGKTKEGKMWLEV